MNDLIDNPRIAELLDQAENAVQMLAESESRAESAKAIRGALDEVYRDLGKAVHSVVRQQRALHGGAPQRSLLPEDLTEDTEIEGVPESAQLAPLRRDGWYTEEIEPSAAGAGLFDFGESDDHTEIPEGEGEGEGELGAPIGAARLTGGRTLTFAALKAARDADSQHPLAAYLYTRMPWHDPLRDLLDLTTLPEPNDSGVAIEASKIQWATSDLKLRLVEFPEPVKVALIGMLAARAQALLKLVDVDVGPKQALARLSRYTASQRLPGVAGLAESASPEHATWLDDARAWLSLLEES